MSPDKPRRPTTAKRPRRSADVPEADAPTIADFVWFVTGDDLGMVVRSHLGLEVGLNQLLSDVAPEGSELDRLPFLAKVDVCIALRRVSPELRPAFVIVNRIRNRFAHSLHASVTEIDAQNLMAAIPATFKEAGLPILRVAERPTHKVAFGFLVLYLSTIPDAKRDEALARYAQDHPRLAEQALKAVRRGTSH